MTTAKKVLAAPLIGLIVLAGVAVFHLLFERVGLDVVDVIAGQLVDGFFVGADGRPDYLRE